MTEAIKRTVVITGGSKGIGRAIALAFARPDTQIFFNYSSDISAAEETQKLIAEAGGTAVGLRADVSSEKEVTEFFNAVLSKAGRIDVLVNNAGITRDGLIVRMKEKDWDDVLDTNLKGVFLCSKLVAKPMIKQHFGRIINITSVVGAMGNPGQANYVASKAGIIGFTKALARELASRNITVNAVAPGYVDTEMTLNLSEKAKDAMIAQIPLGRTAKPEDIAGVVEFLASEKAAYITGQVIHVNGGMYM
ncbi:MAG: 3-oxoacyl-[acyl-carrier-protein] reductase [Desulfobacteraceae bacterium IS3]|nr:MAG: 3-oxoacyl-[acyl-carrier-protein] reductase [Desulfobacteraceae bacterium IS3]HAO20500.1 3-oxoacyl-[acyl-carrier-protein] reductase [Desulfobacteraceae bacterium]